MKWLEKFRRPHGYTQEEYRLDKVLRLAKIEPTERWFRTLSLCIYGLHQRDPHLTEKFLTWFWDCYVTDGVAPQAADARFEMKEMLVASLRARLVELEGLDAEAAS